MIPGIMAGFPAAGGGGYVGPLDLVGGEYVAYSMARALSSEMLGQNGFTLRRASDNAEMSFAYDATTGVIDTAAIDTWLGGAGFAKGIFVHNNSGLNLASTFESGDFSYVPNEINGYPSISTTNTSGFFESQNTTAPNGQITSFIVAKGRIGYELVEDIASFLLLYVGSQARIEQYYDPTGSTMGGTYAGQVSDSSYVLSEVVAEYENKAYLVDGSAITLQTDLDAVGAPLEFVGPAYLYRQGAGVATAYFVEMINYYGILSAGDRQTLRQNIATFYGITLS